MGPFVGMWRDSWYMWIVLIGFGVVAGFFKAVFFLTLPITLFTFIYFSVMRYDANGNHKVVDE